MNYFASQLRTLADSEKKSGSRLIASLLEASAMEIESLERRLQATKADLDALDSEIDLAIDKHERRDLAQLVMERPRGGAIDLEEGSSDFFDDDVISLGTAVVSRDPPVEPGFDTALALAFGG